MWEPLVTNQINRYDFESLLRDDIPAIVIQEFFDKKTCEKIIKNIRKNDKENFQDGKLKHIGPFLRSFTTRKEQYFHQAKKSNKKFQKIFPKKNNPKDKIYEFITKVLTNYSISIAQENNEKYSSFIVRIHEKGKSIPLHKDEVSYEGKNYNISEIDNQLSVILHLQESEKGGELVIYKKQWNRKDEKFRLIDFGYSTSVVEFSEFVKMPKISSGDLVIINPKNYHKVEKIEGDTPRITVGMFLGIYKKERKIVTWA